MRGALVVLLAVVACKGKSEPAPAPKPAPVQPPPAAPVDLVRARATIDCLFEQADRSPSEVIEPLVETAPAPLVRMAVLAAVVRARRDGETPAQIALARAIDALWAIEDLEGLRTAFETLDAMPGARADLRFSHDGGARARSGAAPNQSEIDVERISVALEFALAGNMPEAQRVYAAIPASEIAEAPTREPYIGALVAFGRFSELAAELDRGDPERRIQRIAGGWLDTLLRMGDPIRDPVAELVKRIPAASEGAIIAFDARAMFRRAWRMNRGAELAPVYRALAAWFAKEPAKHPGAPSIEYDLAFAMGDAAEMTRLAAADPAIARRDAIQRGPLDAALAAALAEKDPTRDLVRLWVRSAQAGADPAFAGKLAAAVCKPPAARPLATPGRPGLKLAVTETARKPQQECQLHDVMVRLSDGAKVVGEQNLEGQCQGACTAAAKREGAAELARIEKAIAAGEASESQTDYNFTDCIYLGPNVGRIDRVGDREVAIVRQHYLGPHDVDRDEYLLAFELCGALHLTQTFGRSNMGSWPLGELHVREADGQLVVDVADERWSGVLMRVTLPQCPGDAVEETVDTD